MPQSQGNEEPTEVGAYPEPVCILALARPATHVCADRNGVPTAGTDKACWWGARIEVLVDAADELCFERVAEFREVFAPEAFKPDELTPCEVAS